VVTYDLHKLVKRSACHVVRVMSQLRVQSRATIDFLVSAARRLMPSDLASTIRPPFPPTTSVVCSFYSSAAVFTVKTLINVHVYQRRSYLGGSSRDKSWGILPTKFVSS